MANDPEQESTTRDLEDNVGGLGGTDTSNHSAEDPTEDSSYAGTEED